MNNTITRSEMTSAHPRLASPLPLTPFSGILFKLQKDWKGLYGGDFNAMKTGGLELKGLMRYFGCRDLHVSLMAVIDYRGFRLVAQSILPIDKSTHVYGSADGGNTIIASNPDFNAVMECDLSSSHYLSLKSSPFQECRHDPEPQDSPRGSLR